ncbi:MAG: PAS domain-containing protein [Gemmatimonadota bacterium]|nr:PAS domain-containing protein [Gemmatimonadota bacterium]
MTPQSTESPVAGTPAIISALLMRLPVGILLLARDGALAYVNDAARRFWAAAHASAAPSDFDAIVTRALLAGETVRDAEITLDVCGSQDARDWLSGRHFIVDATPLSAARDGVDGLVMTILDVTARREMERFRPLIESIARL